jgi:hypothetical protein
MLGHIQFNCTLAKYPQVQMLSEYDEDGYINVKLSEVLQDLSDLK